jgi:hypothetical protein
LELDLTQYSTPVLLKMYSRIQEELEGRVVAPPASGRKKESRNYKMAQAALAAQGYSEFLWVDEKGGADFTAYHSSGKVRIQLKPRVGFWRLYVGKNIMLCAVTGDDIYLYPHDQMLEKYVSRFQHCESWIKSGAQHWPHPPAWVREWLAPYKLAAS